MNISNKRLLRQLLAYALVLGLSACGSNDGKKPASQIAAKVNSEEISVHQINFVLNRSGAGNVSAEQAPKVRREILEKLVDQQLAVEQAIDKKLDRSPDVIMAIEAARREILARAYLQQIASALSKPSSEQIKEYYAEHPQLFAERRIYNIQEIVIPSNAVDTAQLRDLLDAGKSMTEIANWLKAKDIKFASGSATRAAEQIPLDLLPKIHALKNGQSMVIETDQKTTVMHLVASQSAPVTEAAALPRIQQYLGNQRAGEAAASDFKQLKAKATITYLGEFATAEAVAPAPIAEIREQKPDGNASIEKGVAGLK